MSEARLPGIKAVHAIVTPVCRQNRGDQGAVDEALRRVREEALAIISRRADAFHLHFVLTLEPPPRGLEEKEGAGGSPAGEDGT